MSGITIKVKGLNELTAKTDWDVLLQPEIEPALETIGKRMERQGKGLGAKRNSLTRETQPLGARVRSSLNPPRTTGQSWQEKNEAVVKSMAPRVLAKMVKRVEERWAADNAASVGPASYEDAG